MVLTKKIKTEISRKKTLYLMLFVVCVPYFIFFLYPMIDSLIIGFYRWSGISPKMDFVWIDNYIRLIFDEYLRSALINTLIFTFAAIFLHTVIGFAFAWLAFKHRRTGRLFISIVYIPMVVSFVAVGLMWRWIYDPNIGFLTQFFKSIKLEALAAPWLANKTTALIGIILTGTWYGVGFSTIVFSAGLRAIPQSMFDSAKIDGLSDLQAIRHVILPQLKEVIAVIFIFIAASSLKTFDLIWALTGGGPARDTEVVSLFMYQEAFASMKAGYASAAGIILFLAGILLVVIYLRITRVKV